MELTWWHWAGMGAVAWLVTAWSLGLVLGLIARRRDEVDGRMRDAASIRSGSSCEFWS